MQIKQKKKTKGFLFHNKALTLYEKKKILNQQTQRIDPKSYRSHEQESPDIDRFYKNNETNRIRNDSIVLEKTLKRENSLVQRPLKRDNRFGWTSKDSLFLF